MDLVLSPVILKAQEQKKEEQDKRTKIVTETLNFDITAADFPHL